MYPHNGKTTRATCPHFFFEGHRIKWAKKANIWPNMAIFEPKIHFWGHGVKLLVSSIREPMRKFLKSLMFILEKGTFFFEQLFPVVARTWLELSFFCQESRFLAQKSDLWTKNRNFGPKKRVPLFRANHVLATTGKSCSKKKSAFAQIIKGGNVILGDFLG